MKLLLLSIKLLISTMILTITLALKFAFNVLMFLCSILALAYIGFSIFKLIIKALDFLIKIKRRRLNMNAVKRLLALDAGKIKTPEKEVALKLQKLDKEEVIFPCKAVDPERVAELQEDALEFKKGDVAKIRMYENKVMTIIEGCPSVFKDKDVMKHFGAATPKGLVKILLLSGEMDELKKEIDALGGYEKEDIEDIKN